MRRSRWVGDSLKGGTEEASAGGANIGDHRADTVRRSRWVGNSLKGGTEEASAGGANIGDHRADTVRCSRWVGNSLKGGTEEASAGGANIGDHRSMGVLVAKSYYFNSGGSYQREGVYRAGWGQVGCRPQLAELQHTRPFPTPILSCSPLIDSYFCTFRRLNYYPLRA